MPVRIFGDTTKGPITVDQCLRNHSSIRVLGRSTMNEERYTGQAVLVGAHFSIDESLAFSDARVRVLNLEHWIGMSAVSFGFDEESNGISDIHIEPRENIVSGTSFGELELAFEYKLTGDHTAQTTFMQGCALRFRFNEPRSLEDTLSLCTASQHLVTIGMNEPVSIEGVSLWGAADTDRMID